MDFIIFQSFLWSVLSQTKNDRAIIVAGDEISLKLQVDRYIMNRFENIFLWDIKYPLYCLKSCQAMSEQQGGQRKSQSRDFS